VVALGCVFRRTASAVNNMGMAPVFIVCRPFAWDAGKQNFRGTRPFFESSHWIQGWTALERSLKELD
jgi:hypothetical protein